MIRVGDVQGLPYGPRCGPNRSRSGSDSGGEDDGARSNGGCGGSGSGRDIGRNIVFYREVVGLRSLNMYAVRRTNRDLPAAGAATGAASWTSRDRSDL